MSKASLPIQFQQYRSGKPTSVDAEVIVEAPVSLSVNGKAWLTFMCTPVDLEALAAGFLFNEDLVHSREDLASVRVCAAGDHVDVWLHHSVEKPENWRRTSGCTGGITHIEEDRANGQAARREIRDPFILTPQQIHEMVAQLFQAQELYRRSGGVHTSALSDGKELRVVAEDIGRHNTLDKIAGRCLLEDIHPLEHRVLLTTGRISSEMLQKSARLGAAVVISRTSPSSLSIEMADSQGITLIGYAKRDRFIVYTHKERVQELPQPAI